MNDIVIREFNLSDMDSIRNLQPDGWDDITFYFYLYSREKFCYPIVALENGDLIGVANGISNGRTGWLSHIIVSPEYRRRGIGYRLTSYVISCLDELGCETKILIATELGEKLYEKMDFKKTCLYRFYKGDQLNGDIQHENIRRLADEDIDSVLQLDRMISG